MGNKLSIDKKARETAVQEKTAEQNSVTDKLNGLNRRKKHKSEKLEKLTQYYKDLGPPCYDGDSTYEERKAARTKEIDALVQAEGILSKASTDISLLARSTRNAKFMALRRH